MLRPLADALRDRDRVYAVIRGTGVTQDGHTNGITVPNGASQERTMRAALSDAGLCSSAVSYVEAHGTGTPVGDPIEASAIGHVYGADRQPGSPCLMGSVKTNIGHLEGAAGVAGLMKATDHVDVLNESFGANPYPDSAQDPISIFNRDAVDAGVTVVASTGDAGIGNTHGTAGTDPWVIAAGASTTLRSYAQQSSNGFQLGNGRWADDQVSALSSAGISQNTRVQDLLAPGDLGWALCSARLLPDGSQQYAGCTDNNGAPSDIQEFGGTSQSAPFTAGAAALVVQAYRAGHGGVSPSPQQVRRVLDSSADDQGLPAQEQGAGLLDSDRAVQLARSLDGGSAALHPASGQLAVDTGQQIATQLDTVAPAGSPVTGSVTVTNTGPGTQRVTATTRQVSTITGAQHQTVTLTPTADPFFIDQFGRKRGYQTRTLDVPVGTDRLLVAQHEAGPGTTVIRLALLDPQGTYTAYSLPQGAGSTG